MKFGNFVDIGFSYFKFKLLYTAIEAPGYEQALWLTSPYNFYLAGEITK